MSTCTLKKKRLAERPPPGPARTGISLALSSFHSLGSAPIQAALLARDFFWIRDVSFPPVWMFGLDEYSGQEERAAALIYGEVTDFSIGLSETMPPNKAKQLDASRPEWEFGSRATKRNFVVVLGHQNPSVPVLPGSSSRSSLRVRSVERAPAQYPSDKSAPKEARVGEKESERNVSRVVGMTLGAKLPRRSEKTAMQSGKECGNDDGPGDGDTTSVVPLRICGTKWAFLSGVKWTQIDAPKATVQLPVYLRLREDKARVCALLPPVMPTCARVRDKTLRVVVPLLRVRPTACKTQGGAQIKVELYGCTESTKKVGFAGG
ncbi:hypothetical protein FB451DRAFT_1184381 [Mycena latifolia]|nr:hypothetical protein FB451DRAFT_1184381 [Mycena latifolia]